MTDLHRIAVRVNGRDEELEVEARRTLSTMLPYPVQRQRFPDSSFRISSRVGVGLSSSMQRMVMRKPGAQNAHWNA